VGFGSLIMWLIDPTFQMLCFGRITVEFERTLVKRKGHITKM